MAMWDNSANKPISHGGWASKPDGINNKKWQIS